jgi:phosphatidyl-myo-inositol alpha-mannosyltransferase
MKIGLVCPYNMFQYAGGVQDVVLQLQKHLTAKGHKVLIITPRPTGHFEDEPEGMVMIGKSRKTNSPFATMVDWSVNSNNEDIDELLEREKFDILHFHEPWQPFVSLQILSRSGAVNIATFHAKLPDSIVHKTLLNMTLPYTTSVIKFLDICTAVSGAAADYIKTFTDMPITIIPNGIDLERFTASKAPVKKSKKKTILFLGRLEKRKGLKYLILAYALLREQHNDVRLVIAGNGVQQEALEELVAEYDIPDVSFLGYWPEEKKIQLMASADVFCSPAIFGESFGIVLLEAMSLGVPVVAGDNPGYVGVLKERGLLSLVTPQNTTDFARRLELFLYDEAIRKDWQNWATEYVKQFRFEAVADKYEELYKQSLKKYHGKEKA